MTATPPVLLSATPAADDPFLSPAPAHHGPHRYASFDNNQLHSLYNSTSPSQAKRALEAHLKDTDRRIQDASRLGQTLLKQRKDLSERLKDVEHEKDDNEIGPELQKKLSDLEKEYTEVGRESARTFLPKNRVVSQDLGVPGSPAVFAADSRASPSKVSAPSRRQRNQPANRVHDIEFATEISTSLLAQVRQLQAVLAEKDDALKTTTAEKAQLEADIANLMQKLKMLDESEQKYKEENWNLETQLQEIQSSLKDLTDKEQRLNQQLKTTQAEKDAAQRELEELKHAHGKLYEDHELFRKQNDSELHGLRRDVANHEAQRDVLNKKVEELTSQNTELARAVAARWHDGNLTSDREFATADEDNMADRTTPEDSPPPSPSKTPARNGMLESETLKSSLTHAHRMIQNLKNNIHREKTEKIELKRMLQDARDEVESLRSGGATTGSMSKRRRSAHENARKQIRPDRLGATRNSTQEVIMDDDDDWEDHGEASPTRAATLRQGNVTFNQGSLVESESTDAFETANEREGTTTESDAFETGVETLGADSSDELTETEGTIRQRDAVSARRSIYSTGNPGDRRSYMSTASTDDEELASVSTPVQQQHPKLRLRNVHNRKTGRSNSLLPDDTPGAYDSPTSMRSSDRGTPRAPAGQSLMAELEGLSDEESDTVTPSRISQDGQSTHSSPEYHRQRAAAASTALGDAIGETTPVQTRKAITMVDSGMMTEPWEPETKSVLSTAAGVVGGAVAGVTGYALGRSASTDKEVSDEQAQDSARDAGHAEPKMLADEMATPRKEAIQRANMGTPRAPLQKLTELVSQQTRPDSPPPETPQKQTAQFGFAHSTAAETEPVTPTRPVIPEAALLAFATTTTTETEPVSPARVKLPELAPLAFAPTTTAETKPVAPPSPILPEVVPFGMSSMVIAHVEPEEPPLKESKPADPLSMSAIVSQQSAPVTPAEGLRGAEFDSPSPRNVFQRPDFYTDSGFSPEKDTREVAGSGTETIRPGAAFFAAHPAVAPSNTQFPPRTSSIRSLSPGKIYANKSLDVYEDENRTAPHSNRPDTRDSRSPFSEVSNNAAYGQRNVAGQDSTSPLKRSDTSEMGTQTVVSSDEIDHMMRNKDIIAPAGMVFAQPETSPRRSSETAAYGNTVTRSPRRPASSGSIRKHASPAPPLPQDHNLKIAAASGNMGPPVIPASAYKSMNGMQSRSRTPSVNAQSIRNGSSSAQRPRLSNAGSSRPTLDIPSPPAGTQTRRSSVTSFASELEERFHIQSSIYPEDLPPATDPRMIQAITQTMIGEHLWKYTRKAGRSSEISGTRHRRFFWVHPYTRTLYWSETDPSVHGAKQSKAKSVAIQAVRVISDNNTYPPGLHTKSLVVVTPGREIVFTAPTSVRHETWFNALSYLLLRTGSEREEDVNGTLGDLTRDDVDEFNPQLQGRSASRTSGRTGLSLSTYNSRGTGRTSSPMRKEYLTEVPTLSRREGQRVAASNRSMNGNTSDPRDNNLNTVSNRFGTLFKSPGSLRGSFSSSRRSKSALSNRPGEPAIYDASVIEEDSEDELRAVVEKGRKERDEAGILENVRACCDGKHDVGSLSRATGRHMHAHGHTHTHAGTGSVMSRHTSQTHAHHTSEPATVSARPRRGE